MKYIVYLLTIVLPVKQRTVTRLADVHVSAGQHTSASGVRRCETIELLERETPDFISPDLWPPSSPDLNPVDYKFWGSCNSGSIRRPSTMWMNTRSDWLKSGLVWSRTLLTPLSTNGETVCVLVFARRADISNILPCIKCNISLVVFSPGSVEGDVG